MAAADAERQRLLEELYIRFYRWSAAEVERDCERLLADLAVELQFTKAPLLPGWEKGSGDEGPAAREETVMEYSIVIHNAEEGGYWAEVPALEGCYAQGETIEETLEDMKGAIETHIEFLIEDGREIPKDLGLRVERVTVSVPSAA